MPVHLEINQDKLTENQSEATKTDERFACMISMVSILVNHLHVSTRVLDAYVIIHRTRNYEVDTSVFKNISSIKAFVFITNVTLPFAETCSIAQRAMKK